MVLSNQIAGFFDHQYVQKESVIVLHFWHEDTHKWKETSEHTYFSWLRSGIPRHAQIGNTGSG